MLSLELRVAVLRYFAKLKGCPSQNLGKFLISSCCLFSNFYIEPVGTKAPTFSNDLTIMGYTRSKSQSFAMLCPAQSLPVPVFR